MLAAQVYSIIPHGQAAHQYAFAAGVTCPTVNGNYVAGGTLGAGGNTYWQPPAGTLAASGTSLSLGTIDTTGGGAGTGVKTGDESPIIQMQDGTFNTTNTSAYGSGGSGGTGFTSLGNAGLYEYVSVQSATGTQTTGSVTIQGTGTGGGLLNSYYENTAGNQRYQIVRVPQYTTATLSNNFTGAYWDGNTGGIAAIDMASTLNLNGASVYATGNGFRGGAFSVSSTSPASVLNTDYVDSATMNGGTNQPAFGTKGEGVNGSPHGVFYYTSFTTPSAPASPAAVTPGGSNGYSGGDQGMGAPGNAGGGGTDDDPAANDQNTGGGGGANGGAGGNGGYPWTPQYSGNTSLYSNVGVHSATGYSALNSGDIGGRGGSSLSSYASVSRVFMGGGGGAGSNNNGSNNNAYSADGSSGGVGGGIILMRLADTSGSAATLYANGTTGLAPDNDGGGGGGAGGTIVITSPSAYSNITANVNGAAGTTAAAADSFPGTQHGPGGGGGGGVVVTSSSVTASATGGSSGTTTPSMTTYGATNGSSGVTLNGTVSASQVPGLGSGAQCYVSGTSGTATLYNGPYDSTQATYFGANYTGSYDGTQPATNNNDFAARSIAFPTPSPQPSPVLIDNSPTGSALSPVGNTFSVASAPTNNVEHSLYYTDSAAGNYHAITINGVAPILPAQWSVQICPDNAGSPGCGTYTAGSGTCKHMADRNLWESTAIDTAGSTASLQYCYYSTSAGLVLNLKYWAVYTGPTGTYTAFARYDGYVDAYDNQATPAENKTHDELYAGFIPVGKSYSVVKTNCTGSLSVPASGVCPAG